MKEELYGKSAIITGAGRGIGAAAAKDLAKHGVSVLLVARTSQDIEIVAQEIRAGGGKAETKLCDVSVYQDVEAAVKACTSFFGKVDILVNNAGVIEPIARISESDPDSWGKVADINYKGVYYGLRAVLPLMEQQGEGVIINLSSGAASSALEGWSHYCSTKAAVYSLTRCAHAEYHKKGVRIIGLSPGTVATDMMAAIRQSGVNPVSQLDPSVLIPPQWVGEAISWLCTSEAAIFSGTDFSLKDEEGRKLVGLVS